MKALALISGGLDSMLAAKIVLEQNIAVEGINFFIGFAGENPSCPTTKKHGAKWVAEKLGIKLHIIDTVEKFKPVLFNPKYGYGKYLNPCLDCKIFMVAQAKKFMEENKFDFLITGEVLGQRPKSQRKDTLPLVAKNTDDRLLRPLSAKLLPLTLPERENWINRELLYGISGRSRKPQLELAKKFGWDDFPQPAGGCLLTDCNFTKRMDDLFTSRNQKNYTLTDIELMKIGRHLRLNKNCKIIVGRNEQENNYIEKFKNEYITLECVNYPGALILVEGPVNQEEIAFIARVAAYFSKGKNIAEVEVKIYKKDNKNEIIKVKPLEINELKSILYV